VLLRSALPPPFHLDLFSFPVPHILSIFIGFAVCPLQRQQGFSKPTGGCVHSFADLQKEKPNPVINRAQREIVNLTGGLHDNQA
jgi:hypothetical protein